MGPFGPLSKDVVIIVGKLKYFAVSTSAKIAQPPLSQQIRQLEDELGAPLFFRTKKKVELSPAGQALLPQAYALIKQAKQCAEAVRLSASGQSGSLRIGCVEEAVHFVFPSLLTRYRESHPAIKIQLIEMHSNDQLVALESGDIDFAFGYSEAQSPAIRSRCVMRGRICLAMDPQHPLSQQKTISLSKCDNEAFIFPRRTTSPQLYDFLLNICSESGLVPQIPYNAEHIYTVMGLVRAGCGLTLFPEFLNRQEWPGVIFRPLRGKQHYLQLLTHWKKDREEWTTQRAFIEHLQ